jgi:MraZ protein
LFLGHHLTQLKKSNRLPIRSDWQKSISSGVYLTQGFDRNILILMPKTFQEIYARLTALTITDPLVRLLLRMFLSTATYVENVENETISLPQELLEYANLGSNVVVVGQGEYVEVWSTDLWELQQTEIQDAQANSQRFSELTISTAERTF